MLFMKRRSRFQRARQAGTWMTHDERGRVLGLVLVSVAVSIAIALLTTAIVGAISRRRAAAPGEPVEPEGHPEAGPAADEPAGVPVMEGTAPADREVPAEA